MYPSYASQSSALIDNVLPDAFHRDGEDTCLDGGHAAVDHSAVKTVSALMEEISGATFYKTK